ADQVDGFGENDARLRPFGRHAVRLRSTFAVTNEHVQPDTRQKRRLAVLPADQQEKLPAPPIARLLVNKAEHRLEHGLLPELQPHGLPDPLALAVAAEPLAELNRRRLPLPNESP